MGADILKGWLAGTRPAALWVEYDDYAGRVFAGAPADWLGQAVRHANTLAQARKVVRTDILTIDLSAPCLARAPATGSPLERVRAALEDASARAFGAEVLDVLAHKFAGDTDLVLKIASPRDLLRRCGEDGEPSFDDLDEVATLLAGQLRTLADKPVAALLVARAGEEAWTADEADACEPLFSAAHHYGWITVLGVDARLLDNGGAIAGVDLLLCAEAPPERLASTARPRIGGGLSMAYWRGDSAPSLPAGTLAYGMIPVDEEPERIVARCAALA